MRAESLIWYPEIVPWRARMVVWCSRMFPRWVYCRVAEQSGRVVGFLTGSRAAFSFAAEHVAKHDVWYVAPAWRGSTAARRLVLDFETWGKEIGAFQTRISVDTGLNVDRTGKFLERMGFVHIGGSYVNDVRSDHRNLGRDLAARCRK